MSLTGNDSLILDYYARTHGSGSVCSGRGELGGSMRYSNSFKSTAFILLNFCLFVSYSLKLHILGYRSQEKMYNRNIRHEASPCNSTVCSAMRTLEHERRVFVFMPWTMSGRLGPIVGFLSGETNMQGLSGLRAVVTLHYEWHLTNGFVLRCCMVTWKG